MQKRVRAITCRAVCAFALLALTPAAMAQQRQNFDVPAGLAVSSIPEFARQAGVQIVAPADELSNVTTPAIRGAFDARAALRQLIAGTGLEISSDEGGVIVLRRARSSPSRSGSALNGLEEILVTAQKKEEKIQDVPASLNVLSGSDLRKLNATELADYASYVAGFNVASDGAPGQTTVTLRGITSEVGATVATYIDDTPISSSMSSAGAAGYSPDLMPYDLAQVEVLRGPQGTLYGANGMGGLLKYVLIQPDLHKTELRYGFDGMTTLHTDSPGWGARASLNLPLIDDRLAARVSLSRQRTPGFIDDAATGKKGINDSKQTNGRLAVRWNISDAASLQLNAIAQNIDAVPGQVDFDVTTGQKLFGDLTNGHVLPERFKQRLRFYSATFKYSLGWADFVSASSASQTYAKNDVDYTNAYGPFFGGLSGLALRAKLNKYTEELRLSAPSGSKWEWLVGAFYTYEDIGNVQRASALDLQGAPIVGLDPLVVNNLAATYREYAAFGGLTYHVTDRFDVAAGLRWSRNAQRVHQISTGLAPVDASGRSSESVTNYMVSPRFRITPDVMVYARVASGYRPGGPNAMLPGVPPSFRSDSLVNYEVGIKSKFLDGRAMLDISAFYLDWSDIQIAQTNGVGNFVGNGGKATSKGIELTAAYAPIAGLQIGLNAAFTDARLSDDVPDLNALAGDRVPSTPRWSAAFTSTYTMPIVDGWDAEIGGGFRYVGLRSSSFPGDPRNVRLPDYKLVDLHAAVMNDRWTIRLYARNVTNERAYLSTIVFGSTAQTSVARPRTIGLSFDTTF